MGALYGSRLSAPGSAAQHVRQDDRLFLLRSLELTHNRLCLSSPKPVECDKDITIKQSSYRFQGGQNVVVIDDDTDDVSPEVLSTLSMKPATDVAISQQEADGVKEYKCFQSMLKDDNHQKSIQYLYDMNSEYAPYVFLFEKRDEL